MGRRREPETYGRDSGRSSMKMVQNQNQKVLTVAIIFLGMISN